MLLSGIKKQIFLVLTFLSIVLTCPGLADTEKIKIFCLCLFWKSLSLSLVFGSLCFSVSLPFLYLNLYFFISPSPFHSLFPSFILSHQFIFHAKNVNKLRMIGEQQNTLVKSKRENKASIKLIYCYMKAILNIFNVK